MSENVLKKSNVETTEVAGHLDIPIRAIAAQTFVEYCLQQMARGQELFRTAPDLKLYDAFTPRSVLVLSDLMYSRGAALFGQRLSEFGKQETRQASCVTSSRQVSLGFVILSASEGDVERPVSIRRHL
jgi:hypothetical protein